MKVTRYELPDGKGEMQIMEGGGEIEIMLSFGYAFHLIGTAVRVVAIDGPLPSAGSNRPDAAEEDRKVDDLAASDKQIVIGRFHNARFVNGHEYAACDQCGAMIAAMDQLGHLRWHELLLGVARDIADHIEAAG